MPARRDASAWCCKPTARWKAPRIAKFLGAETVLDREAMVSAVRPALYRNRA